MADFRWKDNQANTGTVRASDRREALRSLAARGIEPSELLEDKTSAQQKRKGSVEAASDLVSRLKPLLKSGLTAGEALRTTSKRSADPKTASLAKEIWQETASGIPLHASVGTERGFPSHASALLRAGEAAGDLTTAFESLDALMRRRKQARQAALAAIAGDVNGFHVVLRPCSPKRIGVIPTPWMMTRALGFVDILQAHE